MIEILTIFTKAVRKAQAENRKLGLPNVFCDGERVFINCLMEELS